MDIRKILSSPYDFKRIDFTDEDEAIEKILAEEEPLSARVGLKGRTPPPETWDTPPSSEFEALACAMLADTVEWDGSVATLQRVVDGEITQDELELFWNTRNI